LCAQIAWAGEGWRRKERPFKKNERAPEKKSAVLVSLKLILGETEQSEKFLLFAHLCQNVRTEIEKSETS